MKYTLYKLNLLIKPVTMIFILWCINFFSCTTNTVDIPEIIQTPVDLQIQPVAGGYEISFKSDNRENGFSGYGFFLGNTKEEASAAPPSGISEQFCPMSGGQVPYFERIRVMAGANAPVGYLCGLPTLVLNAGQFVAVRARVERENSPWSLPVIGQVP